MYQPAPSTKNPLTVEQLNRLYKRSPSPPPRINLPPFRLVPPVSALVGAAALVLLTPKATANEDAILRRLKKEEIEKKIALDPPETPKFEPPFTGGQGDGVLYEFTLYYKFSNEEPAANYLIQYVTGPIGGVRSIVAPLPPGSGSGYVDVKAKHILGRTDRGGNWWNMIINSITTTFSAEIRNVRRMDGQPDTDGNLPSPTPTGTPKPNTLADPNKFKRERGDRRAPAQSPKFDNPPLLPGSGWDHSVPNEKRRKITRSGTPSPTPKRDPLKTPAPTKIYFPQQKPPVQSSPPPTPQPTPQERPFPPLAVPGGISPQSTPQTLPPPSQKTDTAPIPIPTSRPAFSPPAPGAVPTPNRAPIAIPAPNPTPQPVVIYGPSYDPGSGGPITYSSPPQNFVPNPTTLAPQPQAPPQIKPPTEPAPTKTPIEEIGEKLRDLAIPIGTIAVGITQILRRTTPEALENAAAAGTCRTTQPGGCTTAAIDKGNQDLLNKLGIPPGQAADLLLLGKMDLKLGNQIVGGLSGGIGRMSNFLGIDRALSILTFLSTVHNASMLTSSLKVTLLETLSSVGNATGLLQTSEGDNVDLNKVFDNGIEAFITSLIGTEAYASMKLTWRKYSSIYRAGSNVLSNVGNMFSSIGNGIEVIGERTGKIGNALQAASVVRENAYNYMSEKINVHTNKFMTFQTTVGGVTEVLEAINEVAESTIEGQQAYTEAVKATTEFKKELAKAEKNPGIENEAIKKEAEAIKANLVKDPTGEDETGLLSFLTDL